PRSHPTEAPRPRSARRARSSTSARSGCRGRGGMGTVRTGTPRYYHVAAGSARRPSSDSFLPHRVPIVAQFARQHLLHALRLRVGKGIEPGVQIWATPHAVTPHVRIVLDPVLVALEPRLGVEPRHPHIESRLAGV